MKSINILEAIKCLYYIGNNGNKKMCECNKFIDSFAPYFLVSADDSYEDIVTFLMIISQLNGVNELIEYIDEPNDTIAQIKLKMIMNSDLEILNEAKNISDSSISEFFEYLRDLNNSFNLSGLFKAIIEDEKLIEEIISLIAAFKYIYDLEDEYDTFVNSLDIKEKDKKKVFNKVLNSSIKTKSIKAIIGRISSYVVNEDKREEQHRRAINREKNNNLSALEMLEEGLKKPEVTNIRTIVKKISDKKLQKDFLIVIYNHNKIFYNQIYNELMIIRKNSSTGYILELKKYGIDISDDEVKQLMHNSLDDFKIILSFIGNKILLDKNKIIYILKNTNIDIVNKIKEYLSDGYILSEFVFDNILLFDFNSKLLDLIDYNISLFNKKNINPKIFSSCCSVLIGDSRVISKNLDILGRYNLFKSIRTTNNYLFILEESLEEKIDKFIEYEYIQFVINNLDLLNITNINRLEILKRMNYAIDDIDNLFQLLNSKKFAVIDDKVQDYFFNALEYMEKEDILISLEQLENRSINYWTYSFNGVLVSSIKVERLVSQGMDLYDAIFYNMNLTNDEYSTVIEDLSKLKYLK